MNKILIIISLIFLCGCSVSIGEKCLYTDEGTRVSSPVWFGDKTVEISKENCNQGYQMIWLIIFIGVMAYAIYRVNTFTDDVNPYNFFDRRDNNK